jgi:hypothetical protein
VASATHSDWQTRITGESECRDDVGRAVQRAIAAGRRSIIPFQTLRTAS